MVRKKFKVSQESLGVMEWALSLGVKMGQDCLIMFPSCPPFNPKPQVPALEIEV